MSPSLTKFWLVLAFARREGTGEWRSGGRFLLDAFTDQPANIWTKGEGWWWHLVVGSGFWGLLSERMAQWWSSLSEAGRPRPQTRQQSPEEARSSNNIAQF